MVEFGKEFGLDKERKKLEAGITNFSITHIEIKESKKSYEFRQDDKLVKGKIKIAHIDGITDDKKPVKFYSPNMAIVASCIEMKEKYGAEGTTKLREPIHIAEVKTEKSENNKDYLFFS